MRYKPSSSSARHPASRRRRGGWTLIETTLTTIIVGLAVTALVKQVMASTVQNRYTLRLTTACLLAENCREMMAGVPFADPLNGTTVFGPESGEVLASYNDMDDFDGFDSNTRPDISGGNPVGPVDAQRRVITEVVGGVTQVPLEWRNWRQQITVEPVNLNNLSGTALPKTTTNRNCLRITANITYQTSPGTWDTIVQLRWIKTR